MIAQARRLPPFKLGDKIISHYFVKLADNAGMQSTKDCWYQAAHPKPPLYICQM